jgi:cytochrome c553
MTVVTHDTDRKWRLWSASVVGGVLAFGCLTGFIIIPVVQGWQAGIDPYTAICRSLGILPGSPAVQQPTSTAQGAPVSVVAWTPEVIRRLAAPDTARGREIALNTCAACHGENGLTADPAQYPNMAGQSPFAIYKQLHDYRTGARKNEQMQSIVSGLADDQIADVSAYYGGLERARWDVTWVQTAPREIDMLVRAGDSSRGLPACESCHNPTSGGPIETPVLFAQTREYIAGQMQAYKRGDRTNDLYARMRTIARKLSDDEIRELAQYYFERR